MANVNRWGSNLTFVLAMIGSAVGLGNIWRYPYVLYSNGGGAFYIPYLVAILTLAIPFLILEYGVGYHYQSYCDSRRKNTEATDLGCWGAPGIRLLTRVRLGLMGCLDCQLPHNNF